MTDAPSLPLEFVSRESALEKPDAALVFVHGRGADMHDLLPLAPLLDPDARCVSLAPNGPQSLPPGRAWYDVFQVGYPDFATFWDGFAALASFLDALPSYTGIPIDKTILIGFSQGCVMSFATCLAEGRAQPAGIAGLSGFVPIVNDFALDPANVKDLPIFSAHGMFDPVIDPSFGKAAATKLKGLGADIEVHEYPIDHSISPQEIADLRAWLDTLLR